MLPMHKIYKRTQCIALLYAYKKKKKGHMAYLLGFGKSLCFNWVGST